MRLNVKRPTFADMKVGDVFLLEDDTEPFMKGWDTARDKNVLINLKTGQVFEVYEDEYVYPINAQLGITKQS